jgi:hypothetical protein
MADQFLTDLSKLDKATQDTLRYNGLKSMSGQTMTPEEYLASRGGVNPVTKKYGDSYNPNTDLNDAEYLAAVAGKTGLDAGKALNAATEKKLQAFIAANPDSPEANSARIQSRLDKKNGVSKTVINVEQQTDGSSLVSYSDGSTETLSAGAVVPSVGSSITSTSSNTSASATLAAEKQAERQSAYDLLYSEFQKYGLESLVAPLKGLITTGASPAEFTIKLRETPEYQKRFAGNAQRIAKGLTAIDEATYLATEDKYQNLMRNYGLPDTYWKPGQFGTQEGFTNLIANDVSAVELENRLQTAQNRVVKANPEVAYALKAFYPDITNGDILAYALDPKNALDAINRKVTAAEIGGAALSQGLTTSLGGAEGLAAYGITKDQAQQGYQTVAGVLPRASQLADIYGQNPYNQQVAEAEVFGTQGAAEAKKRREKLVSLEQASFSGSSGVGALGRDKAAYGLTQGQTGQY